MLQPGFDPEVISLRALAAVEYNHGFRNPRGDFPAAMSSLLRIAMTLAKMGLAQLVPATKPVWPPETISTSSPMAATSY